MLSRRTVAAGLATLPLAACASRDKYSEAMARTWRLLPAEGPGFPARALVHAATLAANSHNTQPWRFAVSGTSVRIQPDLSRRTPIVDPDDHHLFASLGCAAETMLQAAGAYGWAGDLESVDARQGVQLRFRRAQGHDAGLAAAIPRRASTRAEYHGRPVAAATLRRLERAAGASTQTVIVTDPARLAQATEFIVRGNAAQVRSRAFRRELADWIRFDEAEALRRGDGLFAGASGNPTLPRPVGRLAFELAFTEKGETDRIVRQMRSSAGLAVFSADRNDPAGWVDAGRAYTRFALLATALGLKTAFLNQPVEDPPTRSVFAAWLGASRRPDLVVRFGEGPDLPRSPRRPVQAVLIA